MNSETAIQRARIRRRKNREHRARETIGSLRTPSPGRAHALSADPSWHSATSSSSAAPRAGREGQHSSRERTPHLRAAKETRCAATSCERLGSQNTGSTRSTTHTAPCGPWSRRHSRAQARGCTEDGTEPPPCSPRTAAPVPISGCGDITCLHPKRFA